MLKERVTMKLKSEFITQNVEDTQFLVPVGSDAFSGVVRSNRTAAFIVDCLKNETTKDEIVDAMCQRYSVAREVVDQDVERILDFLRKIDAIDE